MSKTLAIVFSKTWKFAENGFIVHHFKKDTEYAIEDLPQGCIEAAVSMEAIDPDVVKEASAAMKKEVVRRKREAAANAKNLEKAADTDGAKAMTTGKASGKMRGKRTAAAAKKGAPPKKSK